MTLKTTLVLFLAFWVTLVQAQQKTPTTSDDPELNFYGGTAAELMRDCRQVELYDRAPDSPSSFTPALARCGDYIFGFVDGVSASRTVHPQDKFFCLPDKISKEELTRVVVKFGNDHPEQLHFLAAVLLIQALAHYYPCAR